MPAIRLDGKALATHLQNELSQSIKNHIKQGARTPGLAVILIGEDPASKVYVRNKQLACEKVGIVSHLIQHDDSISESELIGLVDKLNQDEKIDGILVQFPLPAAINTTRVTDALLPHKDVDGFHPYNFGRLAQRTPTLRPCTPYGIMQLLQAYDIPLAGKRAVVVGASNIVGKPMALELANAKATVTLCHSKTLDLQGYIQQAEIIIAATGKQDLIDTAWLHENQIVIDVGIHRLPNGKIRGDIDFEKAKDKVGWITPVPGGVGPMTITTLLQNTWLASLNNQGIQLFV